MSFYDFMYLESSSRSKIKDKFLSIKDKYPIIEIKENDDVVKSIFEMN